MRPSRLFDTELAGRLAGYPRVGLGPLVEEVLGLSLEKGHAAADWSTRPLPGAVAAVRGAGRRGAGRPARRARGGPRRAGQARVGRGRSSRRSRPPTRPSPGRPVAAHVRAAPGPAAAPAGRGALAVGGPRRDGPAARPRPRPRAAGLRDRRGRAGHRPTSAAALGAIARFNGQRTRRNLSYWWDAVEAAARAARGRAAAAEPAVRLAAAGPGLARPRPGRGGPAGRRPARRSRRSPTSTACRWRTCWPPTPSDGCAGSRPPTCPRPASTPCSPGSAPGRGSASSPSPRSSGSLVRLRDHPPRADATTSPLSDARRVRLERVGLARARAIVAGDLTWVDAAPGWPHADTLDGLRIEAEHATRDEETRFLVVLTQTGRGDRRRRLEGRTGRVRHRRDRLRPVAARTAVRAWAPSWWPSWPRGRAPSRASAGCAPRSSQATSRRCARCSATGSSRSAGTTTWSCSTGLVTAAHHLVTDE